jgi:hypothetical protein
MKKLALWDPPLSDRIIGFTIPKSEAFYICDHDEVWRIVIGVTPSVEATDHSPYEFVKGRSDFLGLVFAGCSANNPILRVGQNEIAYDFDPRNDFVTVEYKAAGRSGEIAFRTFSGDWFAASFSDEGKHLVLAEPYALALYEVA